jgi:hypothetical protein
MRVSIEHTEKSQGLIFKKKLYGLSLTVTFSEEEKQVIEDRKLHRTIIIERGPPADVNAEKHANRGLAAKIATAAIKGADANNFHLTIGKLLKGKDTYFLDEVVEAKAYEEEVRDSMHKLKSYITLSEGIEQKSDSFEL